MKVHPFEAVDSLQFGATAQAIKELLGPPIGDKVSRRREQELRYTDACYRFDSQGSLVEVTIDAPAVQFGRISVPFKLLAAYLKEQDNSTFEKAGFVVSPAYGIALDPASPSWVTAFSCKRLVQWHAIASQ